MEDSDPFRHLKRWWFIPAGLAAVLVASSVLVGRRGSQDEGIARSFPAIDMAQPVSRPPIEGPWESRLPRESDVQRESEEQAIDALLNNLVGQTTSPEAKAKAQDISREFAKEPKLKKAYQEYLRKPPETRPSRREFLAGLKAMPAFRQLAMRFATGGSSGASAPTGRLRAFPGAQARDFPGAQARDVNQVARVWADKAVSGVGATGRARTVSVPGDRHAAGAGPGARRGFGAGATRSGALSAGDSGPGYASLTEPIRAPGAGAPGSAGAAEKDPSSRDSKAITDLEKIKDPDSEVMRRFCENYSQFCSGSPLMVKTDFRMLYNSGLIEKGYGVMGACFRLKMYSTCQASCGGSFPCQTGWNACLEGYDNAVETCIPLCEGPSGQPGCIVPQAVRLAYCDTPPDPPTYCIAAGLISAQGVPMAASTPTGAAAQGSPMTCLEAADTTCCFGRSGTLVSSTNRGYLTRGGPNYSVQQCSGKDLQSAGTCRTLNAQGDIECTDSLGNLIFRGGDPSPLAGSSDCKSGWGPSQWVMSNSGSQCEPVCTRYCVDPDMARSGSCSQPPPPPAPQCTCVMVPCKAGETGTPPPGNCRKLGSGTIYYGSKGEVVNVVANGPCP